MKSKDGNKKNNSLLFTALVFAVCAAIFLFTETGYNKPPEEAETTDAEIPTGIFTDRFRQLAFKDLYFTESSKNTYSIDSEVFEEPAIVTISEKGGFVKAFALVTDTPVFVEEKDAANPIEARLMRERTELYKQQRNWLDSVLANMIHALDFEQRLTEADLQYIQYTAGNVINSGKQKEMSISQYGVRIYIDDMYRLTVSVQDQKEEIE